MDIPSPLLSRCAAPIRAGTGLLAMLVIVAFIGRASADLVVSYEAGSSSPATVISGVSASVLGLTNTTILTKFTVGSFGNPDPGFEAENWTTANAGSADSAFVFSLSATADLHLTSISVDVDPQGAGPQEVDILYSVNGGALQTFGTIDPTPAATSGNTDNFTNWDTLPFTGDYTLTAGSTITFYVSGFDAKNTNKDMNVDNIQVIGTIPEPDYVPFLALTFPLLFLWRKNRRTA